MLHKKFNQNLATYGFLSKKLIHMKYKVCLRFKIFKKAVHKNNPPTHPPQQNKAVLATASYFKVFTPERFAETVTLRLFLFTKKGVSSMKQKK